MGVTASCPLCDPDDSDRFIFYGIFKKKNVLADDFRHNLMRQRKQDVLDMYRVISVLGNGSIGSVSVVRKRADKVGGSARTSKFKNALKLPDSYHGVYGSDSYHLNSKLFSSQLGKGEDSKTSVSFGESDRTDSSMSSSFSFDNSRANVFKVKRKKSVDQHTYALKTIHSNLVGCSEIFQEMRNEISILRALDHPNIVRVYEVFESRNHKGSQISIVLELCNGGDLYGRDPYSERDAAKIIGKVLSAVEYMHNNKVMHRDLKFENILFETDAPNSEIKIIDFGLSKRYDPSSKSQCEGVGTIYTMAPEVFEGDYDERADLWSVGVITFMLLSSSLPFSGKKRRHVMKKILHNKHDFRGYRWKGVTQDAINFVSGLLVTDRNKRMTARSALNSDWQKKQFNLLDRRPSETFMDNILGAIENYSSYGKFKKLSLMVIAQKSNLEDIQGLRDAFDQYDSKNNGEITRNEFKSALVAYDYTDKELDAMFDAIDVDETGLIHYTEFLAATIEMLGIIEEERLAEAFDRMDRDGSGSISAADLSQLLGSTTTKTQVKELLDEADRYKDNQISYEEFLVLFDDERMNREAKMKKILQRKCSKLHNSSAL